jgi:hypothetical protein
VAMPSNNRCLVWRAGPGRVARPHVRDRMNAL